MSGSPWHADGPRPAATGDSNQLMSLFTLQISLICWSGSPFPSPKNAGGAVGLHYLKFGFFFSDLQHGNGQCYIPEFSVIESAGGSLQVVRGSHLRPELDGKGGASSTYIFFNKKGINYMIISSTSFLFRSEVGASCGPGQSAPGDFNPSDYDVVKLDVAAGTVVVFHQAQWHSALPNESEIERLNAYISYCPIWLYIILSFV